MAQKDSQLSISERMPSTIARALARWSCAAARLVAYVSQISRGTEPKAIVSTHWIWV